MSMCGSPEKSEPRYLWGDWGNPMMMPLHEATWAETMKQIPYIFGEPGSGEKALDFGKQSALEDINYAERGGMDRINQMITGRGLTGGAAIQEQIKGMMPYAQERAKTSREWEAKRPFMEQQRVASGADILRRLLGDVGAVHTGATQGWGAQLLSAAA